MSEKQVHQVGSKNEWLLLSETLNQMLNQIERQLWNEPMTKSEVLPVITLFYRKNFLVLESLKKS